MSDVLFSMGWLDDRLVPLRDLAVWVPSPGVQYGMCLFEGIKAYPRSGGVGVLALREHLERLYRAVEGSPFDFRPPLCLDEAVEAVVAVLRGNAVREECYVRPCLYHAGTGDVALRKGTRSPTRFAIYVQRWTENCLKPNGARCTVSPYAKPSHRHVRLKTGGNYVLLTEAKAEAASRGYDDCVMLDHTGLVAEAAAENLVLQLREPVTVADQPGMEERVEYRLTFVEPDWHMGPILPGITARILREVVGPAHGLRFVRRPVRRVDLARAEGVLLAGTAAEVTHMTELDGHVYNGGRPTREMARIIKGFRDIVEGRAHQELVTLVET